MEMSPATRQVAIRDLVPDAPLDFDLVSPSGSVILRRDSV